MDEGSTIPGSPEDWLRYARSDLAAAGVQPNDDLLLETLCYHAQQAADKTLKALLVAYDIDFPWTHNLKTLIDRLPTEIERPEFLGSGQKLLNILRYTYNIHLSTVLLYKIPRVNTY